MRSKLSFSGLGLCLLVAGCAPSQFKSSRDVGADVKTRAAGFAGAEGRVNIDCFVEKIDGNEFNKGERPKSIGLPMNCPNTTQSASAGGVGKFDVAVVLDVSENMLPLAADLKSQLAQVLNKLVSDGRVGTLSATSFRTKVIGNIVGGEIQKVISELSGTGADWNPNALKTIDPNSTDWVTNDAAKAVFQGLEKGIENLKAGSNPNKMLIFISASTGTGSSGTEVGPSAKVLSEYSSRLLSGAGQLVFNYAANNSIAQGLSRFDPTPIEQLDLLASTSGIKPVRVIVPGELSQWGEVISTRAAIPASNAEACPLSSFEVSDSSGQPIFKKEVPAAELSGVFEASLPDAIPNGTLKLKITRKCARSGIKTQNVSVTLAQKGALK